MRNTGLLNVDAPDLRDLQGTKTRDYRATFCSGTKCNLSKHHNYRGALVYVGNKYLDECPKCSSRDGLYFDTVARSTAKIYFDKIDKLMPDWIESIE